jgi:hypothetical protein
MKRPSLGIALFVLGLAPAAHATGPAGIWSEVSHVVYEPSAQAPTRIQIHGCFSFATSTPSACQGGQGAYNYSCPASGYMYFECPAGDEALCKLQWSEIEASIGQPSCVGWGQFDQAKGSVRAITDPPSNPDPYPLGMGVDTVGGTPCLVLDAQCSGKDAGAGGSGGSVGAGGSGAAGAGGTAGSGGGSGSGGASATGGTAGAAPGTGGSGAGSNDDSSGDEGGCTLSSARTRSGGAALGMLALGAAVAFARRRRR